MHNLGTVYKFETIRTLKKKTFWITVLAFPLMMFAIFAIVFFSNKTTNEAATKASESKFSIQITDKSNAVVPEIKQAFGAKDIENRDQGIAAVKDGKVDAYYFIPEDLKNSKIEVYGKDSGLFDNQKYSSVAEAMIKQSALAKTDTNTATALQGAAKIQSTTYKDGKEYDGFKQAIFPGLFLVLFYFLIATFSGQTLTSTTEEKENRVIEMILTTIESKTLVVGKILALITLSLLQIVLIIAPILVAYLIFKDNLNIPNFDLSTIPVDWTRIILGFLIFASGYFLYTGLLVAIGAAAPTAKEASSYAGIVLLCAFAPLYMVTLFVSSPNNPIVQVISYFPITSPIPLLLRNAVGNLQPHEALIAISLLVIASIFAIWLSVVIFKKGILEYTNKISFKSIFSKK